MASITQTIASFNQGISEQPDHLKFQGQVKNVENAIPDITYGLFKRPGAARVGTAPLASVASGGSWFHYFRDDNEGAYVGQVDSSGTLRVWKASGDNAGAIQNIKFGAREWFDTTWGTGDKVQRTTSGTARIYEAQDTINSGTAAPTHTSGTTNNWKFIETVAAATTRITNYLVTSDPENLQFLTINDTTFVNNRDSTDARAQYTTVGETGSTFARPEEHCAMLELLRTENGRQYGINIFDSSADASNLTTLKRATRLAIQGDSLDEGNRTGHCPGIGTQVFSVTAASSYAGTTTNWVRGPKSSHDFAPSAVNVSNEHITINNHGLVTGEEVVYTTTGNIITNLPEANYFVVKIDDNTISLATSYADALADTVKNLQGQGSGTHSLVALGAPITSGKSNLTFRITVLGQQGISPDYNASGSTGADGDNYRCSYQRDITLLHGGEGWAVGDQVNVTLDSAKGGANVTQNSNGDNVQYTIRIEDSETTQVKATLSSSGDGLVRPAPTPFDSDTAVTADTILAGILTELPSGIDAKVIGPGIYLSSNNPFNVEIAEEDLMRVFQKSVNEVTLLPNMCRHGYIVKVANARMSDEDDYYLQFQGENNLDGAGSWSECAIPGITNTLTNMPLVIQRTGLANGGTSSEVATFTIREFDYAQRRVGDLITNPMPTFVGKQINKVLFFRNRLAILAGENVVLCRPGTLGEPDFFIESALTVSASDPIDISAASMFPSQLFDGIDINAGLLVFSTNQQFLLSTDDTVLNPDTAKLRSVSTFNYNKDVPPIALGTTVAYIDNSGKYSRVNEMANTSREGEPQVVEISKLVPSLLPKNINLLTNSRENNLIMAAKAEDSNCLVYGHKYFVVGDRKEQQAWFKWKLNNPLKYHFIINDTYYFIDTDNFLQSIKLVQSDDEPSITQDNVNYLIHLDNHTDISTPSNTYNPTTNLTTFSNVSWMPQVTTPNHELAIVDIDSNAARVARYAKPTTTSTTSFTVPGDWTGVTLKIGYLYDYLVEFPRIYPTKVSGEKSFSDVNSSLILHRIKLHFGKIGLYETNLKRLGKPDYPDVYDSNQLDEYEVSDAPYLEEHIQTIPIYEKNKNVDITLKSSHPAPATLRAMAWEGDYSPMFYRRV